MNSQVYWGLGIDSLSYTICVVEVSASPDVVLFSVGSVLDSRPALRGQGVIGWSWAVPAC